jgi:hypothetical protein
MDSHHDVILFAFAEQDVFAEQQSAGRHAGAVLSEPLVFAGK